MPYKSDKQRRYMNRAASEGKIDKKVVNEFNDTSKGMKLPETVYPKTKKYLKYKGSK